MTINITQKAKEQILNMTKDSGKYARIIITGQRCGGGLMYALTITKEKEDDNIVDVDGIKLLINKNVQDLLGDINIAYEDEGLIKGFVIK